MAAVTICSDFGAQKNNVWHCFHCFPIYLPWSDGTECHDLSFLRLVSTSGMFLLLLLFVSTGPFPIFTVASCHAFIFQISHRQYPKFFRVLLHLTEFLQHVLLPLLKTSLFVGGQREALCPWQRSWGRRLNIRKGVIKPQESPWKSSSIYPHNQSLPTLLLCALTYTSDFIGAVPHHLFWRRS